MTSKKGSAWSEEEDKRLKAAVESRSCESCHAIYRADCSCKTFTRKSTWDEIAKEVGGGRTHGGVQARWCSVLDPHLDTSEWTEELDSRLLAMYSDKKYPSWSTRARALSAAGKRRNGGEVAARYFLIKKKQLATTHSESGASKSKRARAN